MTRENAVQIMRRIAMIHEKYPELKLPDVTNKEIIAAFRLALAALAEQIDMEDDRK